MSFNVPVMHALFVVPHCPFTVEVPEEVVADAIFDHSEFPAELYALT